MIRAQHLQKHLEKLFGFQAIALNGSFQSGARAVGVSLPALSKSVKQLEIILETQLLVRHKRGVELTESGRILLTFCERLFAELPDLEKRLKNPSEMSGVLRIGSYETLAISFWPEALVAIAKQFPELQTQISASDPLSHWRKLDEGILHLIVDAEPIIRERYFSKVLYTDKFGLFVHRDFARSFKDEESLPMAYVRRATDKSGRTIKDVLDSNNIKHELHYDFDSFTSVKAVAEAGLAIGVLPHALLQKPKKSGLLREFLVSGKRMVFGEHRICVTCLEERRKERRIVEVTKFLQECAPTLDF